MSAAAGPATPADETFDVIVVGAGSAGAALARRLAEHGDTRVLLLEAGAPRERDFWIRAPLGVGKLLANPRYMWFAHTVPQDTLAGQQVFWPHGRLPGGSSSVNGMVFVRGDPAEYDAWRDAGNPGWGFADLLPYFRRLETARIGDPALRGRHGPVTVTVPGRHAEPLRDAFLASCAAAGLPLTDDYNGAQYEGAAPLQLSVRAGERCSTAMAYLGADRPRTLELRTGAVVQRVLIEDRQAIGVEYRRDGVLRRAWARGETVLSAGAIRSPQLLELSGVGAPGVLADLGIPVRHALRGVGENLIDHLQARLTFACTQPVTLNEIVGSAWRRTWMGVQYVLLRRGWMTLPSVSAQAIVRLTPEATRPEAKLQLQHFSGQDRYARSAAGGMDRFPGFSIGCIALRPGSRGRLHACSADPEAAPRIDPRYLDTEADRHVMVGALRLARRIARAAPLSGYVASETRPGPGIADADDGALLDYVKRTGQTCWHPAGTCRMGRDADAVVDAELRVHGIGRLRVADASVMPTLPSSNTNAPAIMIGEKAADLLRHGR